MDALTVFKSGKWENLSKSEIGVWFPLFVVYHAIRNLFKDNITDLTASLAFASALAIVPLLSVVVSVLALVGLFDGNDAVLAPFLEQVLPSAASAIGVYLNGFATHSAASTVGVGAMAFLGIGIFLFHRIERTFNTIWMSPRKWSFRNFLVAFPSLILLGPIFVGISFILTARVQLRLEQIGVDPSFLDVALPPTIAFVFFFLLNYFLPRPTVKWHAALIGGLFTTIAFEIAKYVFNFYITEGIFEPYNKLYGTLGLLPMFMIWLYTTWLIVLLGVELAYCTQNLRTLVTIQAAEKRDPLRKQDRIYNPFIGVELFAPIARAFKQGSGPLLERDLLEQTGYSAPVIRQVVESLVDVGALNAVLDDGGETKLIPAKQLDDIALLPMIERFFDADAQTNSKELSDLYAGLQHVNDRVLRGKTALSLVGDEVGDRKTAQHKPMPKNRLSELLDARPLTEPLSELEADDSSFNHFPSKPDPVFSTPPTDALFSGSKPDALFSPPQPDALFSAPSPSPSRRHEATAVDPVYEADAFVIEENKKIPLNETSITSMTLSVADLELASNPAEKREEKSIPKAIPEPEIVVESADILIASDLEEQFESFDDSLEMEEFMDVVEDEKKGAGLVEKNLSELMDEIGNELSSPPPMPEDK